MASAAEQMAANLSWGQLGRATELRQRIWFTLGLLIIYRLGTYIPVPGIDGGALRSFMEQKGSDFSANMAGKLKMVLQCVAAGFCLYYLSYRDLAESPLMAPEAPAWVWGGMIGAVWAAVLLTAYSGVAYVIAAVRLLRQAQ